MPRRRALVVLSSVGVAQLIGCGATADGNNPGFTSPLDPDLGGSTTPPGDSGTTPPVDSGTTPPTDSGSKPPVDSGTTPPTDSGSPPTDTGSTSCSSPKGTNVGATSSFPANSWTGLSS
ncbi:MAG: hypothetical protein ACHREM_18695, partial [Polyangiales bacterium]